MSPTPIRSRQSGRRPRVLHIITGLETGGAETSLTRLVAHTHGTVEHSVCSLTSRGTQANAIEAAGVQVDCLGWKRALPSPRAVAELIERVRASRADVVHGWMYHGNLAASVAVLGSLARPRVLWSVRHALDAWDQEPERLRRTIQFSALLSRSPDSIIYNSARAAAQHAKRGFSAQNAVVIPNGFDLARFAPDRSAGVQLRDALGIASDVPLIGLIARTDPLKDHVGFVEAAAYLSARHPRVQFLLAGRGTDAPSGALASAIAARGLTTSIHRLGERSDLRAVYSALNIATLTSRSEGFPNAVGEAMSCGVPCAVTDVGDAALLVGNTGEIVAPGQPEAMAIAWEQLLSRVAVEGSVVGERARAQIATHFSLDRIASQYQALYAPNASEQAA